MNNSLRCAAGGRREGKHSWGGTTRTDPFTPWWGLASSFPSGGEAWGWILLPMLCLRAHTVWWGSSQTSQWALGNATTSLSTGAQNKQEPRARGRWLTLTAYCLYSLIRRFCNCCTHCAESILVTTQHTGGECHHPFFAQSWRHMDGCAWKGARQGTAAVGCAQPLLLRAQPPATEAQCAVWGPHAPTLCSPLAQKGARHLRALQFQSSILIAQLIRPFPRGTIQARLSFQVHPSGSFSTWETPRSKIVP